jgi:hypothetical protein
MVLISNRAFAGETMLELLANTGQLHQACEGNDEALEPTAEK